MQGVFQKTRLFVRRSAEFVINRVIVSGISPYIQLQVISARLQEFLFYS